jgi:acetoacetyl-CoA synthetase
MQSPIWCPSPERIARANLTAFIRRVAASIDPAIIDYDDLYCLSVDRIDAFWGALWDFFDVVGHKGGEIVSDQTDITSAKWFSQARLNFAENLLRRRDDAIAIIARSEERARRTLSWRELYDDVSRLARAMRACGIGPGDRVVACMANVPEAVIALLATTSLGAIWSAGSPDYGVDALVDRFSQINPKMLFITDGYYYAGTCFDLHEKASDLAMRLASLETIVLVPHTRVPNAAQQGAKWIEWNALVRGYEPSEIRFPHFPFDHPVYILYSSGTTGKPKAIIHGAGAVLLQCLKEIVLHCDLARGERTFFYTATGWVVWNIMLAALAWGSPIVLFDGSATFPKPDSIFDLIAQEEVSVVRIVPAMLDSFARAGLKPAASHDLSHLKCMLCGSAPLLPHHYRYVYDRIKSDLHLMSPAGGTDVMTALASGNPIGPVYSGEIQVRSLGMKVEVFDDAGKSIIGQAGELVCTKPFPSVPVGFWGDISQDRRVKEYFSMFPGVWRHGDWAEITPRGGVIIYGRSDATLNVNGVRIGTAEIYRGLEVISEVTDAVAVPHRMGDRERIVLFVVLRKDVGLDPLLISRVQNAIEQSATKRHVPEKVIRVQDIPRSLNGKPSEIAVRNAINGKVVSNELGLINPETLALFYNLPDLRD